jgi:ATP-dependent Clp protease ATP-binding subunit ClpA
MLPGSEDSVLKYHAPSDRFLRVRMLAHAARSLRVPERAGRAQYRAALWNACLEEDPERLLPARGTPGRVEAEDALYALCVAVNPELDIHAVALAPGRAERGAHPVSSGPARETRDPKAKPIVEAQSHALFLSRLARRARGLEQRLAERVLGQPQAIAALARGVRRAAVGLAPAGRPLGSFLFVGPTGTGKTELALQLASELYGVDQAERRVLRVDCGEYGAGHETSKLVGAPPGYVGHEHGGALTDALRATPECIVLFDEVEKAHPRLHHLLLGVLDAGRLSDQRGRNASFERALVVLTSNAGARQLATGARALGFGGAAPLNAPGREELVLGALREQFPPEFLGRIGELVLFNELERADARRIAALQLGALALRLRRAGQRVAFSRSLAPWLAERAHGAEGGVRELRRVLERELEAPLAERLLARGTSKRMLRVGRRAGRLHIAEAA